MTGLCGAVGGSAAGVDRMCTDLAPTGREVTGVTSDAAVTVGTAQHVVEAEAQPAVTSAGNKLWVWGQIWSVRGDDGYESTELPPAATCAQLFERDGRSFVERLNGSFVGVIAAADGDAVTLFSDRLGTRPLHWARTADGIVFATNIQALALHPGLECRFDVARLAEYFTLQRTFGVRTPLVGVELLPPGATLTLDRSTRSIAVERYWEPVYDPVDRPRSYFADRLAEIVSTAIEERTEPGRTYGLLLSGGGDSRLVLAALRAHDVPVRAYHLADWANAEAAAAREVAASADADFQLLRRGPDYQETLLETTPRLANFVGYFNQVHAGGFTDELVEAVDVLWTGHYGDMLFRANHVPTPEVDLGPAGSFSLPFASSVESTADLVDVRTGGRTAPGYIAGALDRSVGDGYAADVTTRGGKVVDHGVAYRSPRDAVVCSRVPITNGTSQFLYGGTLQLLPAGTPFLDNRLVDLALSTPLEYLLRSDLVGAAIDRLSPALARIPHGETGVGMHRHFAIQWAAHIGTAFHRRHVAADPDQPHWTHGPWPDHAELIRNSDFIRRTLEDRSSLGRRLPFLDWDAVEACYRSHQDGTDRHRELYTLATFLEMPLTERVAQATDRRVSPSQ